MNIIYVIVFVLIFLIVYYICVSINFKNKTSTFVKLDYTKRIPIFFSKYFNSINLVLKNINFPYKLTTKKYLFIKYVLPIIVFVISVINYRSITAPLVISLCVFIFPDILIKSYIKTQNTKIIKELKLLNTNLILALSSYVSFSDSLKSVCKNIQDNNIRKSFSQFIYEYEMMGFNIKKPAENLCAKFSSTELKAFMQILIDCENEGNVIENLERFNTTLELSYFKYLNSLATKRMMYLIFGTALILINIIAISLYPILVQVINNLEVIFS